MGTITKIHPINLTKLNNAEYTNFMTRFHTLQLMGGESDSPSEISLDDKDPLGIPQELRAAFNKDLGLMTDTVNQSFASEETAQLLEIDKQRNDLLVFITTTVAQMTKSPLENQRTAAMRLQLIVKPYVGAARLPNQQETAAISGLLVDLAKPGMPDYLTSLNLTEVVNSLQQENQKYADLINQRSNAHAKNAAENSKAIRLRMDDEYDDMSTYAFVQGVAKPTDTTATFVSRLNAMIDETIALYNQRKAQVKAAAQKGQTSETPQN